MKYAEHEQNIYRCKDGRRYSEVLRSGKWTPAGVSGLDAALHGSPMEEDEAKEYVGGEWPAEDKVDSN